jgi:2-C-methyl-D-erythritol 4-phosphate cytidylyltransferase
MPEPSVVVVIVAAGRGVRYGPASKVLERAGGRTLLEWSIDAAMSLPRLEHIIVVAGEHSIMDIRAVMEGTGWPVPIDVVLGGERRQDSVAAGVAAVTHDVDVVLVHDGARPLAGAVAFADCAIAAWASGAAIVASPVSDTLKRVDAGTIGETVPREGLWAAQTPQGFRRSLLVDCITLAHDRHVEYTDEASMMEAFGHEVVVVAGSRQNIKVTVPEDLDIVDALLRYRRTQ